MPWQPGDFARLNPVDQHFQFPDANNPDNSVLVPIADLPEEIEVCYLGPDGDQHARVRIATGIWKGAVGVVVTENLHPVE
jgi:hypothetical protein